MRLWSLHPSLLDTKGLVALWREGLLAQNVLYGKTKGYIHHPQLQRFRECLSPQQAITSYLLEVQKEAECRGYCFNRDKIIGSPINLQISVTEGQLNFELKHLIMKLQKRDQKKLEQIKNRPAMPHPLFTPVAGDIEEWERV